MKYDSRSPVWMRRRKGKMFLIVLKSPASHYPGSQTKDAKTVELFERLTPFDLTSKQVLSIKHTFSSTIWCGWNLARKELYFASSASSAQIAWQFMVYMDAFHFKYKGEPDSNWPELDENCLESRTGSIDAWLHYSSNAFSIRRIVIWISTSIIFLL